MHINMVRVEIVADVRRLAGPCAERLIDVKLKLITSSTCSSYAQLSWFIERLVKNVTVSF